MGFKFRQKGDGKEMVRRLAALGRKFPKAVGAAMYQEMEIEAAESTERTPVKLGTLQGSHEVSDPEYKGTLISVTISVGGPAAPYALYVHEDLDAFHSVGQAKFLESTLRESAPHMAARVARRVDLNKVS